MRGDPAADRPAQRRPYTDAIEPDRYSVQFLGVVMHVFIDAGQQGHTVYGAAEYDDIETRQLGGMFDIGQFDSGIAGLQALGDEFGDLAGRTLGGRPDRARVLSTCGSAQAMGGPLI